MNPENAYIIYVITLSLEIKSKLRHRVNLNPSSRFYLVQSSLNRASSEGYILGHMEVLN